MINKSFVKCVCSILDIKSFRIFTARLAAPDTNGGNVCECQTHPKCQICRFYLLFTSRQLNRVNGGVSSAQCGGKDKDGFLLLMLLLALKGFV